MRETISREDAIKAMEADIERFHNAPELTPEETEQKACEWLQDRFMRDGVRASGAWPDGSKTFPRLDDGSFDEEAFEKHREMWL